ncbi:MAG: sulfatase [Firmicutes bacterium]|nr:sulfatase [Bacillota bacterium]
MTRPNILFIMSDDHAAHAISAYGSRINATPNLDRIAHEGMRFDNCFCTNSICAPSRATILTGMYNHENGVRTLADKLDGRLLNFPQLLRSSGYQTAMIGKWHLGHGWPNDPTGFDYWNVLPGQGEYFDPPMYEMGHEVQIPGYATDIITDLSLNWLEQRDPNRPFLLMCHHKAPHRPWRPDEKHQQLYEDVDIPVPETFDDDYHTRMAAEAARMRIDRDLTPEDLKAPVPEGLSPEAEKAWKYQRYIKDYLRCVASIDDNVGRILDYLDANGLTENTMVIYTSDQGFFLGDHGWFDKRFMYEESLRMPFLVRYPKEIAPGSRCSAMALNVDFAPTFLDLAGVAIPETFQGRSLRPLLQGTIPTDWQTAMYYRYWMHLDSIHRVWAHYGVRTERYKLIYYYGEALGSTGSEDRSTPKTWELFDLHDDPQELHNLYGDPTYQHIVTELKTQLSTLQTRVHDVSVDAVD